MEKTLEESQSPGGNVHGESLLLPLLQSALEAPEFEQTADSGTESGEDLRSGLILEVQNALEKLSACLCSESSDISLERRNSLLQLVSKLQTNLVVAPQAQSSDSDRAGFSQERRLSGGRFARRQQRQRHGRHTVGVTSEELEDARRLMEEFVLSSSQDNVPALQDKLDDKPAFGPIKVNQGVVKNAMPKPFTNSANTSGTSSSVQTPSNESVEMERLPELPPPLHDDEICTVPESDRYCYKQSMSFDQMPADPKPKLHQTHSLDDQNIELINAVQLAAVIKSQPDSYVHESETDDDTLKPSVSPYRQPNELKDGDTVILYDQGLYPPPQTQLQQIEPPTPSILNPTFEEPVILQTNPIYAQDVEKSNRFNAKKSRMKRANTIDIPKPSSYYYEDADSDGDLTEPESTRRSNYLALRGPIRVGGKGGKPVQTKVPSFEPKTESDKKFLAFINRQNSNSAVNNKISLWDKAGQTQTTESPTGTNWTRKFGNIKTNFERVAVDNKQPNVVPAQPKSSARNFWKSTENQVVSNHSGNGRPRFGADPPMNKHIVTGNLKVEPPHKNHKPQPLAVNKFTHNPHESAFKPIHKTPKPDVIANIKTNGSTPESNTPETPFYLYSPKSSEVQSPVLNSAPWSNKTVNVVPHHYNGTGERRVLSLAASKFEVANHAPEEPKITPRRLSKEKITTPAALLQSNKQEKTVTYVPPVTNAGGVRKLSGQYNNIQSETRPEYVAQSNVKYKSAFAPVPQSRNQHQEQNHQTHQPMPAQKFNNTPIQKHDPFVRNYVQSPVTYEKYADHQNARNSPTINNDFNHQHSNQQHHPHHHHHHAQHHHQHHHNHTNKHHIQVDNIPASFHTTSPTVQSIQMRHGHASEGQNHATYSSPKSEQANHALPEAEHQHDFIPPSHEHREHEPHVFYNNVSYQPVQKQPQRPQYDSQTSTDSVHEYLAVSSKVMSGPVGQQAVTVTNKPKSRDEHEMDAAFNLRNTLQIKSEIKAKSPVSANTSAASSSYKPKFCVNDEPLSLDTLEVTSQGESIVTGKFQIPAQHPPPSQLKPSIPQQRVSPQLSKSDSWYQVVQKEQVARKPSPRASPNARTVMKSKSTHALALPKQFEAGMSKDEMLTKKRTMEAYFGQSGLPQPQPAPSTRTTNNFSYKHRAVNRTKTTQKISTSTTGLCRSRTLPDIVCPDLLDETNVDEAFEDLFQSTS